MTKQQRELMDAIAQTLIEQSFAEGFYLYFCHFCESTFDLPLDTDEGERCPYCKSENFGFNEND